MARHLIGSAFPEDPLEIPNPNYAATSRGRHEQPSSEGRGRLRMNFSTMNTLLMSCLLTTCVVSCVRVNVEWKVCLEFCEKLRFNCIKKHQCGRMWDERLPKNCEKGFDLCIDACGLVYGTTD
ncbi:hypothetical protein LSAT2_012743 [Lamellibrachia satsuma]|nr:hypothetical protein LSAT2_012743 [Lamellibrachia satsuma]